MRILILTLVMSFLSHSAFGAETVKRLWTYLISDEVAAISKSTLLEARKTMAQKGFVLNMKDIEERNIGQLAQLLFDTSSVTKLRIKNLKWNILKSALESKPDLRFDNLEKLDLSYNGIDERMIV